MTAGLILCQFVNKSTLNGYLKARKRARQHIVRKIDHKGERSVPTKRKAREEGETERHRRQQKTEDKSNNRDSKEMRVKTNTVKMKHHPLASLGLKLPLTALERQGISPDSNQALSLYTLKIWLGIPLSPAIEMQELHLHLLFHSTEGTAPPAQYIDALALKKKKKKAPTHSYELERLFS